MTIQSIKHSINRSPLRLGLFLIVVTLTWFALSPAARALTPPPLGGYTGKNTATGTDACFNLIPGAFDGLSNTADGFDALYNTVTGSQNTAIGDRALYSNVSDDNTAIGAAALTYNTTGNANTAIGALALILNTTGLINTATGGDALYLNTTGSYNTANGGFALISNTTGSNNTALGFDALYGNTTGSNNVALGYNAGTAVSTGSYNIDIGNIGAGESNTIRIGTPGASTGQTATYIAGIIGAAVGSGPAVHINNLGKLGTTPSSARFKEAIKPMDKASSVILALQPVTFCYKKEYDPEKTPQFGLVAEEVAKVDPELIYRDQAGRPYSVRYEAVNAMLLNEFLKEHKAFLEEQRTVEELKKQVAVLTAGLQKVSSQLEASKPARQVANNP